jgi:hypothetical protein
MKRHRHTPEQAVRKVREGERLLNDGKDLAEILRALEISVDFPPLAGHRGYAARVDGRRWS